MDYIQNVSPSIGNQTQDIQLDYIFERLYKLDLGIKIVISFCRAMEGRVQKLRGIKRICSQNKLLFEMFRFCKRMNRARKG